MKKLASPDTSVWICFDVTVDSIFAPKIHPAEHNSEQPQRENKGRIFFFFYFVAHETIIIFLFKVIHTIKSCTFPCAIMLSKNHRFASLIQAQSLSNKFVSENK